MVEPAGRACAGADSFTGDAISEDEIITQATLTMGSAAPEPDTWAMMLIGLGGLGVMTRRRATIAA